MTPNVLQCAARLAISLLAISHISSEYAFGYFIGEALESQVLLIKYDETSGYEIPVVVHRVFLTRLGGDRPTQYPPDEPPKLAGPPQR